ncbi:Crp/Fnr family transcriptional regulator [Microvirga zambiensis]|uniref:Crp/Fnr family transcriptional regulator n=1 Tax=Microvirga zambiensis TaxID=1402137 RepID=UPI00191FF316|nr:Crp/Fnr family transcriptional regulator [Microvirga zambiensis]
MAKSSRRSEHHFNQLLAMLPPDEFIALEPHLETVKLSKSMILYETGDDMPYAYFPHDAVISLITVLTDGKTVEVAVFGREALLGLTSALATCRSLGRYVVQISGTASRVDTETLRRVLRDRPAVREICLRFIEALIAQALQSMACNTVHSVEARCCRWLLTLHDRVGRETLPLTHDHLSRMLGVQRSTVSLVTGSLQNAGLIQQGRGVITVTDRPGLEQAVCGCYAVMRQRFEQILRRPPERT